ATAGAASNVATALEEARRQNETARALLNLASSLAETRTVDAVAQQLAATVPSVVDTSRAAVMVWDHEMESLSYRGIAGVDPETEAAMYAITVRPEDMPELKQMLA